jgi:hypothetical protein
MSQEDIVKELLDTTEVKYSELQDTEVAHLVVHDNRVTSSHVVPGLLVDVDELDDGIEAEIRVKEGSVIVKPVHLCFGMLPEEGLQRIIMRVEIEAGARISILAHCTFPNAVKVEHVMDAKIKVGEGARYSYFERHIHGFKGYSQGFGGAWEEGQVQDRVRAFKGQGGDD